MAFLELRNLTVQYGGTPVLEAVHAQLEANAKVGLIGKNGAGKTTLVRAMIGQLEPDAGGVYFASRERVRAAYVAQHLPTDGRQSAQEFLISEPLALRRQLRALEQQMAGDNERETMRALASYTEVRERYDAVQGDEAEGRAAALLARNRLDHLAPTPIGKLSGGEQNRLQILRALLLRPELLVLDEPGNHLDAWGLAWLEQVLTDHPAAVVLISHNRYLLDRVTTQVWELRDRRIVTHSGNYSAYRSATLRQAVKTAADARADRKHLERLEAMVAYLAQLAHARPDTSVGKRLRARRKQLEWAQQEARQAPKLSDETVAIHLESVHSKADIALDIVGLNLGYGERRLLQDATARILVGERVALVGRNGCGKTSLLRRVVEQARWDHPVLRLGPSMRVGYCAQNEHGFRGAASIEENFRSLGSYTRDRVFSLISRYLFEYRDLDRRVDTLSGGEQNRLQLARAELLGANFLILDEPTNHLDIAAREAVEQALLAFTGTVLVVSHDRYLLDSIVQRVLYIDECKLHSHDGGFSDFWYRIGRYDASAAPVAGAQARAKQQPESEDIEARLLKLEQDKIAIERAVQRAYDAGDLAQAKSLSRDLAKTQRIYDKLYAQWG